MAAQINLKVSSDFAGASRDLKAFAATTDTVKNEILQFQKAFNPKQIDEFIDRNRRAAAAVKATDGPLKAARQEQKGLRKEIQNLIKGGIDPQSESLSKLRDRYLDVTEEADKLNAEQKKFNKTRKKTNGLQSQTIKNLAGIAAGLFSIGKAMQLIGQSTRDFTDYSKSIANVNTLIEISNKEFEMLDARLTKTSEQFAVQKKELSAGVYQALSAGAEDLGSALGIVENATILAKGALIENADAVDIVTTALNAYGAEAGTAADVTDLYFTIVKQGKITGEELSQTIGKSTSLFAAAKIPLNELGAGIATLTKVGVPAAEATTQLNGIVNAFLKPTNELTKAIKEYGFASGSALLESEGLGGALEFVQSASGGSLDEIAKLIPNIRGLRGALAAGKDEGAVFNDILKEFENNSGAAAEAAEKQTDGFAKAAFEYEQAQIKLENFRIELGQKILPAFVKFIEVIEKGIPILAGLTGGLAAFLIITKGKAAIEGMTFAFKALNLALKANLFAVIATVIITILIPAIILLVKNWDKVVVFIQTQIEILKERFNVFATDLKSNWVVAIEGVKAGFISLVDIIYGTVLRGIGSFLELAGKLPFVGEKFAEAGKFVKGLGESLGEAAAQSRQNVIDAIAAGDAQKTKAREVAQANIEAIKLEGQARMDALKAQEQDVEESGEVQKQQLEQIEAEKTNIAVSKLQERLAILNNIEAQAQLDNIATFDTFLKARLEQEQIVGEERIAFLQSELQRINELETLNGEEKLAARKAIESAITEEEKRQSDFRVDLKRKELSATAGLFGALSNLIDTAAGKNRTFAIVSKALAATQAGINSGLAFTKTLTDGGPYPLNIINAGAILASGVAQQIKIASTPIPSAQTGGTFEIPDSGRSSRADRVGVMASPGETVSVTPRGEGKQQRIIVELDKQVIIDVMQEAVDSQDLRITTDNIQQGVAI